MTATLRQLKIVESSLVDAGANPHAKVLLAKRAPTEKKEWDAAYVNNLPDSAFAAIAPGGKKDTDGKTAPRSLRSLPYKDASGKVDLPHLRNALARLPQTSLSADSKAKAKAKLEAAAKEAGVGQAKAARAFAKCIRMAATKGYSDGQAETLQEALEDQADRELLNALWDSLTSIFNDDTLSEEQEASMVQESFDTFMAQLTSANTTVTKEDRMLDLSKAAPEIKAHVQKLEADLKAAAEKIAALEAKAKEPEDVLKGLTPEAKAVVQKAQADVAAATERVAKLEDENQTRIYLAKAEALPQLTEAPKDLGALLKASAQKLEKAEYEALEKLLQAANEQIKQGKLFATVGSDGHEPAGDSAYGIAKARAKEIVAKGEAKTPEQAIALVFKRDPKLYEQHVAEQRKGN